MTELNFVERIGLEVLRRRIDRAESHIHEWSDAELAQLHFESPAQCESRLQALGYIYKACRQRLPASAPFRFHPRLAASVNFGLNKVSIKRSPRTTTRDPSRAATDGLE